MCEIYGMVPRRFYIFDATANNVRTFISLFYMLESVVIPDVFSFHSASFLPIFCSSVSFIILQFDNYLH